MPVVDSFCDLGSACPGRLHVAPATWSAARCRSAPEDLVNAWYGIAAMPIATVGLVILSSQFGSYNKSTCSFMVYAVGVYVGIEFSGSACTAIEWTDTSNPHKTPHGNKVIDHANGDRFSDEVSVYEYPGAVRPKLLPVLRSEQTDISPAVPFAPSPNVISKYP